MRPSSGFSLVHASPSTAAAAWGVVVALGMSTQLLFQPFVWRHWPWEEVLAAWLGIAWQRAAVALGIVAIISLAWRLPGRSPTVRALTLAAAIVLGAMAGEMALVAMGSLDAPPSAMAVATRVLQWGALSASIASIFFLWRRSVSLQAEARSIELRRVQTSRQLMRARLQALRSQIEPHFLFNTLATVRRLQRTDHGQGAQLLSDFLAYLHATLPDMQKEGSTLGQEIDLVRAYLGVVSARMHGRLDVIIDISKGLRACEFPPLALATLVENSVKHGIGPSLESGSILVLARIVDASLEVVVADTGVGFSGAGHGGSGIGLANTRERLRTLYGAEGTLRLERNDPRGVRATLRLPASLQIGDAS
ncbi:sensor histidine kinase [soil metagenome]